LIILALLFVATACSSPDSGPTDGKEAADKTDAADLAEKAPESYTPNLPDKKFGGYEFRAIVCTNNVFGYFTFDTGEESGEILDDAIYRRNRFIEEKYDILLTQTAIEDFWQLEGIFKRSVMSGSDDFDVCLQIDRYGYNLAVEGYALSADRLPYLDITRPWYSGDINETFSVGNKTFIAYSDECLHLYEASAILVFNKKLFGDLGMENPYNLVHSDKWTYDKFFDMCREGVFDVNGDGKMTDVDRYGIVCQDDQLLSSFWVSAGVQSIVKDADGMLVLNIENNDKLLAMLEAGRQGIFGGPKLYFNAQVDKVDTLPNDNPRDQSLGQFMNGLALFHGASVGRIPHMRAMETDFGILPYPKADAGQERYYTRVGGGFPKMVPAHAPDPERTSIVLEAIAAESKNSVMPVFKEKNLMTKHARDDESAEMLDIIFDNTVADLGDVMFLDIRDAFNNEMRNNGNFVSLIEKKSASFQKIIDKVNASAANLE